MFLFFGPRAGGMLAPQLGIEPPTPALEGEILTTGLPGKSPNKKIFNKKSVRTVILIFNTQIAVHIKIDPIMR